MTALQLRQRLADFVGWTEKLPFSHALKRRLGVMNAAGRSDPFDELLRLWRDWTRCVSQFAHRRNARYRIDSSQYGQLHGRLTRAAELIAVHDSPQKREFAQSVQSLIKPWVALEALKREDVHTLFALLDRCGKTEKALKSENASPLANLSTGTLVMALTAVMLCCIAYLVWINPATAREFEGYWRSSLRRVEVAVRWSSFVERFSVITVILVLIGIRLATGTRRG